MDDSDSSSVDEFIEKLGLKLKSKASKKKRFAPCMDEKELNISMDIENIDISKLQCVEQVGDILYPLPALEPDKTSTSTIHTSPTAGPSSAPKVTILSDVPFYGNLKDTKLRKNKALMDSRNWKKKLNQEKRMMGENYLGYRRDRKAKKEEKFKVIQDVFRPARSMKPTCKSNYCLKSKFRGCHNITEVSRQGLFDNFWKKMSWEQASVFASCLVHHLRKLLTENCIPVVLYSDGCCAQNRNSILSSALLRLAIEFKTTITQKYLEKGHTQMECDSVHSAIECKLKGKEIYLPDQYSRISETARSSKPYKSVLLDFSFFTNFSQDLIYKSIRPGRKPHDPVVTDIRMLEHRPDGTIWFKLNFDDQIQPIPQRSTPLNKIKKILELPKLYTARLPITKRKFDDLQDLKGVLPGSCHQYYDSIPHSR